MSLAECLHHPLGTELVICKSYENVTEAFFRALKVSVAEAGRRERGREKEIAQSMCLRFIKRTL